MRVLLTGGAGFIGSNIAEYLLNKGYFVRVIDNLSTGNKDNIKEFLDNPNFEFIYGDISNLEFCRKVMKTMNAVCHQAALGSVPRSINDPLSSHISNVNGFLNILISMVENKVKRIVYASSSSVYGDEPKLPKKEDKTGNVLSPYAATKAIDEIYAGVFNKCYGLETIGLRYFNIFGPKQDPKGAYAAVIPKFIQLMKEGKEPVINGDGTYSRDFTYVDNAVFANFQGLTTLNWKCYGEAFNIGAGGQTTIMDLFLTIKNHVGYEGDVKLGELRKGDVPHSNADISKAKEFLKYRVLIDFNQGIENTVGYFMK